MADMMASTVAAASLLLLFFVTCCSSAGLQATDGNEIRRETLPRNETQASTPAPEADTTSSSAAGKGKSRGPDFHWSTVPDPTTVSFHKRHLVGTILHAFFLTGLVICCVLGLGGILIRWCRGQPQVQKFAPN